MDDNTTPIEKLFERAEDYSRTSIELFRLNAIDKSAEIISSIATKSAILLVVVSFVLFLNIGLALWIGEMLGKSYYGFFAVAGFYLLIAILSYLFRDIWIRYPVSNGIILQMMKKKKHERNE
jgi:hypothetical protein